MWNQRHFFWDGLTGDNRISTYDMMINMENEYRTKRNKFCDTLNATDTEFDVRKMNSWKGRDFDWQRNRW